jgi:hypothetical protein
VFDSRLASTVGLAACVWLAPGALWAQASVDKTMAETLFSEGRTLLQAGDYEHACPKLAESNRLDPSLGALLNLAVCHEKQGLVATAWLEFTEASQLARRANERDRQDLADTHAQALSLVVPRLTVSVTAQPAADQLSVRIDSVVLGPHALGVAVPVDPGAHTVVASAPGKKTWTQQVELKTGEPPVAVTVPALEVDPAVPVAPLVAVVPPPQPAPSPAAPAADQPSRPLTVPIYVAGGATILLAGGAIVTGVMAHTKADEYDKVNSDPDRSESERQSAYDAAHSLQIVNVVCTGAAVAGAVLTTVLVLTRPAASSKTALVPWVSPGGAGLAAVGRF